MVSLNRESIVSLLRITVFQTRYTSTRIEKTMTHKISTRLVQSKAIVIESTHYTFQKEDDKCLTKVSGTTF